MGAYHDQTLSLTTPRMFLQIQPTGQDIFLIYPVIFVFKNRQVSYLGIDEWQLSFILKQILNVSLELQSMTSVLGFGTLHGVRWIHFLLIRSIEVPMWIYIIAFIIGQNVFEMCMIFDKVAYHSSLVWLQPPLQEMGTSELQGIYKVSGLPLACTVWYIWRMLCKCWGGCFVVSTSSQWMAQAGEIRSAAELRSTTNTNRDKWQPIYPAPQT